MEKKVLFCFCVAAFVSPWLRSTGSVRSPLGFPSFPLFFLLLSPCLLLSLWADDVSDSNCSCLSQLQMSVPDWLWLCFLFTYDWSKDRTQDFRKKGFPDVHLIHSLLCPYLIHPSIHPSFHHLGGCCCLSKPRQGLLYGKRLSKESPLNRMGVSECTDRQSDRQTDRQAVNCSNVSLYMQWNRPQGASLQERLF